MRWREEGYRELRLAAGAHVVDIGCGVGTVAVDLARRVGPSGRALGVDVSAALIEEARRRGAAANSGARFEIADASTLPLADHSVHAYRAERVFQHLSNPSPALSEARRVLAPGGRVVVQDLDHRMLAIDGDDPLTRRILRTYPDALPAPQIGRSLAGLLATAGFGDVEVRGDLVVSTDHRRFGFFVDVCANLAVRTEGVSTAEANRWIEDQRARARRDQWCICIPLFLASATA